MTLLQTRIDGYFSRIHQIIAKGKISARIRFMLQDVVELRKNKWVPRSSQTTSLKTIDQVCTVCTTILYRFSLSTVY